MIIIRATENCTSVEAVEYKGMQTLSWVVLNMRHTSVLTKKERKKVKIRF